MPTGTVGYFFREAVRRMWVSKRTSFVAIGMIAISLLTLGTFLLVSENLERAVARWQGKSRAVVYLMPSSTPAQIEAVDRFLAAHPDLRNRKLVTPDEALARFKSWFTHLDEVLGQVGENPFPASFEIEVSPAALQGKRFADAMQAVRRLDGVDQVQYDWEWIARLRRLIGIINAVGFTAGGILAIAAAFTIANVIRLTMMLYREEIEIMRLVGATERIIRGPFVVEGILQGLIGGALAVGLLYGAFELARRSLEASSSALWGFLVAGFLSPEKIAALLIGGMLAGWVGSAFSVRSRTDAA